MCFSGLLYLIKLHKNEEVMSLDYMPIDDAITVEQLPIIRQRLEEISNEVQERVAHALALECTEDTVKAVKALRAVLNKNFEVLETKRKEVKSAVMQPYEQFEGIYKEMISDIFNEGISTLTGRINEVEDEVKKQKELELRLYFEEYIGARQNLLPTLDFVTFKMADIKVNLTSSMKSLKTMARKFVDRVAAELDTIDNMDNRNEIFVEYKRTLSLAQAISTIDKRKKAVEEARAAAEKAALEREVQEKAKIQREQLLKQQALKQHGKEPIPEPLAPPAITIIPNPPDTEDPVMTVYFGYLTARKSVLKKIKQMLLDEGVQVSKEETA